MNWSSPINSKRKDFTRILAALLAMLGISGSKNIERQLRPIESAIRRLIFIAAHGMVAKPNVKRMMPKGLKIERKTENKRLSFKLFDSRYCPPSAQAFGTTIVKVKTYTRNPFNMFDQIYWPQQPKKKPERHCKERIEAAQHALDHLPQQARRLVQTLARNKIKTPPNFMSPLRPGRAPGYKEHDRSEINELLYECQHLALEVVKADTS
jgi:hypothetical protein